MYLIYLIIVLKFIYRLKLKHILNFIYNNFFGREDMTETIAKISTKGSLWDLGIELASKLTKSGISISKLESSEIFAYKIFEKYYTAIIVCGSFTDINKLYANNASCDIIVLTEDETELISYKNDVLYLSEKLGIDSIYSLVEYCTNRSRNDLKYELAATEIIQSIGVQANHKGYRYLRTAIVIAVENPKMLVGIYKSLYTKVAEIYNTNEKNVERAIRNAIELAYDKNPDNMKKFFHYNSGKPSNSEVIALAADKIILSFK